MPIAEGLVPAQHGKGPSAFDKLLYVLEIGGGKVGNVGEVIEYHQVEAVEFFIKQCVYGKGN